MLSGLPFGNQARDPRSEPALEPARRFGAPARFAREKVHAVRGEILGQVGLGGRSFVAVEALNYSSIDEADLLDNLKELRLRQSSADSGGPQFGVAPRRQGKLPLHHNVGEIEAPSGLQYPVDFSESAELVGR